MSCSRLKTTSFLLCYNELDVVEKFYANYTLLSDSKNYFGFLSLVLRFT